MNICIQPIRAKQGEVTAITSKSYVHRMLIAAALADGETYIKTNIVSKDMMATIMCLCSLGSEIDVDNEGIRVKSQIKFLKSKVQLDCNESGSTARFLIPVTAAIGRDFCINGAGKLPSRPFGPICDALRENGYSVNRDFLPIEGNGELQAGVYHLPGNVSSQFISGLLFALPLLQGDSKIELISPLQSKSYVELTCEVLSEFGIQIEVLEDTYSIKGCQKYTSPGELVAEGDWSNAAFFCGMGALGNDIKLQGLNMYSKQGDKEIIDLLKKFGADISFDDNGGLHVKAGVLHGIEADVSQIPDLVPILSVIAAGAYGKTRFIHAERLRIKESDRIQAIIGVLETLGVKVGVTEDENQTDLWIEGLGKLHGGTVDGMNDHRIVMSACIAACISTEPIRIIGCEAVNKSYPGFFQEIVRIAGEDKVSTTTD